MEYLESAERYAKEVEEVFCKELIIYEDAQDESLDLRISHAFHCAVDLSGRWMRKLMLGELELHPEYSLASCSLRLPGGDLNVSVEVKASDGSAEGNQIPEWMDTPIGVLDQFTFTVLRTTNNPVKVLYKQLEVLAMHIHTLLALRGTDTDFITQELLAENDINDPICIHQMASLLCSIGDFFDIKV